jgi:hypothetical protein
MARGAGTGHGAGTKKDGPMAFHEACSCVDGNNNNIRMFTIIGQEEEGFWTDGKVQLVQHVTAVEYVKIHWNCVCQMSLKPPEIVN